METIWLTKNVVDLVEGQVRKDAQSAEAQVNLATISCPVVLAVVQVAKTARKKGRELAYQQLGCISIAL
jgi:hypothetical protein